MSDKTTYYQRNRDKILNRAKKYYEGKKEGKKKIQRIIWRKKYIKREYGRNKYQNMSKENKQKLKECQKNYRDAKKSK